MRLLGREVQLLEHKVAMLQNHFSERFVGRTSALTSPDGGMTTFGGRLGGWNVPQGGPSQKLDVAASGMEAADT
jgi:hypothetical protein